MKNLLGIKNINCHSELDSESINLIDNKELALIDSGLESGMTRGRGKCLVTPPEFLSSQSSLRNSTLPVQGGRKFAKAGFTLAEGATHVGLPPVIAKAGFTLAEVLITLGIIGVVAAMTIPNLMTKIQWLQLHASFKHAYSTISNGLKLMQENEEYSNSCFYIFNSDGGYTQNYSYTSCIDFFSNFAKTLKIAQYCEDNAYSKGCIPEYHGVEKLVEKEEDQEYQVSNCSGTTTNNILNVNPAMVFMNGPIFMSYKGTPIVILDTNGKKGPNKWGYDIFTFHIVESMGGDLYFAGNKGCGSVQEKGGKTVQQMLTRNK